MKFIMVAIGLAIAHGIGASEAIGWLIRKTGDAAYEGARGVVTGAGVISKPETKPTPQPLPVLPTTSGSSSRSNNPNATLDPYSF